LVIIAPISSRADKFSRSDDWYVAQISQWYGIKADDFDFRFGATGRMWRAGVDFLFGAAALGVWRAAAEVVNVARLAWAPQAV